jgi:hypothetical protein
MKRRKRTRIGISRKEAKKQEGGVFLCVSSAFAQGTSFESGSTVVTPTLAIHCFILSYLDTRE